MFYRFPKIENLDSIIDREFEEFKSPVNEYVITEKVDGSNVSITLNLDNGAVPFEIYSRNGNQFSNIVHKALGEQIKKIRDWFVKEKKSPNDANTLYDLFKDASTIVIFGELYGKRIMNRLDYGIDIGFMPFYFVIDPDNKKYKTNQETTDAILFLSLASYRSAPIYKRVQNEAVQTAADLKKYCLLPNKSIIAKHNKVKGSTNIEGYVIYSFNEDYSIRGMLKVKDEAFKDKVSIKKQHVDLIDETNNSFNGYFTKNRVLDAIAKYGDSFSNKDLGNLIKDIISDAKDDFYKEHSKEVEKIIKETNKKIYKVNETSISLIKKTVSEYLESM